LGLIIFSQEIKEHDKIDSLISCMQLISRTCMRN
jgi:hypothetical protein